MVSPQPRIAAVSTRRTAPSTRSPTNVVEVLQCVQADADDVPRGGDVVPVHRPQHAGDGPAKVAAAHPVDLGGRGEVVEVDLDQVVVGEQRGLEPGDAAAGVPQRVVEVGVDVVGRPASPFATLRSSSPSGGVSGSPAPSQPALRAASLVIFSW